MGKTGQRTKGYRQRNKRFFLGFIIYLYFWVCLSRWHICLWCCGNLGLSFRRFQRSWAVRKQSLVYIHSACVLPAALGLSVRTVFVWTPQLLELYASWAGVTKPDPPKIVIFLSFFFFTRIPEIKCIHVVQRNRRREKQDEEQDLDSLNCFEQNYVKRKGQ